MAGRSFCGCGLSPASRRWPSSRAGWQDFRNQWRSCAPEPGSLSTRLLLLPLRDRFLEIRELVGWRGLFGGLARGECLLAGCNGPLVIVLLGQQLSLGALVGEVGVESDAGVEPTAGIVQAGVVLDAIARGLDAGLPAQ